MADGCLWVDVQELKRQNPILDEPLFTKVSTVLILIMAALLLSPFHKREACWFTLLGMFAASLMFELHHIDKLLKAVEWATLIFFACLFIFVECLNELGLIRAIGEGIMHVILNVDINYRLPVAITIILWISTIGSAFLESLPFTTTIVYILLELREDEEALGIPTMPLVWALSVGACVGGIGSIMGSSANLVCISVSERYTKREEHRVVGKHFLQHGFWVLMIITPLEMLYQWLVFCVIKPYRV
eukprot:gnl/MRDRNA2_/MRDRNA2_113639_c0_seq1.p1 gnl/MRDRNA2_/MRDRNA2_113639_c0~~gnl/MRDRNA2_/MRDRNA2_113639_c0_seq1.p1  ORF type:complete len:258 (-),score=30.47 gnl/MRDRNA2_/MRDRNA2_113639_c0_seq1:96-830(-)